ncbi:SDR family oxidoreductase, partial [Patescibacteria group bacterium]|nr:SDR family oxidoreductase [Patescibacteria group bacterium]
LVNNVGVNAEGGILDTTNQGALRVFNTNLIGPFFLTQRVAKEMVERKIRGSILFTSSVHGKITQLRPAYTATKAALEMLVCDIALELAEYGIRVNAVAPGAIAIRGEKDKATRHVPLGYRGVPQDIANAMVFLASEKGSYITGQTLTVDGGFSLAHTHYWIKKGVL